MVAHQERKVIRASMAHQTINDIDLRRRVADLKRKQLYEAAGISHSTYGRLVSGKNAATTRTLDKLTAALDRLIAAKESEAAE